MAAVVELTGISKRFGGTQALAGVDLTIERGTVHALVGENGAGKSTLGKVIAGVIQPDSGEYILAGRAVSPSSPRQALEVGVTMMAQELSLVPARSVVENVYLGIEDHSGPFVRRKELDRRFAALVEDTGISVPAQAVVGTLPISDRQKVEILRAVARDAGVIVMDEPTARLTGDETAALKSLIRRLADAGRTVIFVSHFLAEVLDIADVVTVMRDGEIIRTSPVSDETEESLIEGMTGRSFSANFPPRREPAADAKVLLSVEDLTREPAFANVDLVVREGEIVVITGLVGSGRSEVLHTVFGDAPADSGSMTLAGRAFAPRNPAEALRSGLALVPESRKEQGLFLNMSVESNITMPHLHKLGSFGFVSPGAALDQAEASVEAVGVRTERVTTPVTSLSGGNQQKVLFARALVEDPVLLLADEPTRGVDVAAKRAIYDLLVSLAERGMGILMVSSETEEVLGLAHRVIVMHEGRVVAEFDGRTVTEEQIMNAAFTTAGRAT
jgi:simple sugar transport system ATP-binding protein/ribose transport system ATP-binding protein